MSEWALTIALDQIDRLRTAELVWNAQAAVVDDYVWIRGDELDDALQRELVTLSDDTLWLVDDGRLIPAGRQVPVGRLPETNWCALRELIALLLPTASIPSGRVPRIPLSLRRGGLERTANLQVLDWDIWLTWADTAEERRLNSLRFVAIAADEASTASRAIVRGETLPGLSGALFRCTDRIALPLGYSVDPPLDTSTVLQILDAEHDGDPSDYILRATSEVSPTPFSVTAIAQDSWLIARRENIIATDEFINQNPTR